MNESGNRVLRSRHAALALVVNVLLFGSSAWAQATALVPSPLAAGARDAAAARKAEKADRNELPAVAVTGVLSNVQTNAPRSCFVPGTLRF